MALPTSRELINAGPFFLRNHIITQLSDAPSDLNNADYNKKITVAPPSVLADPNAFRQTPYSIVIGALGLPIEFQGQVPETINPYLAGKSEVSPVLRIPRTPTGEVDLLANQISALSQVDWSKLESFKAEKRVRGKSGPNKAALITILEQIGYKIPRGLKSMKKMDVINTLLAYRPVWEQYQRNLQRMTSPISPMQQPLIISRAPEAVESEMIYGVGDVGFDPESYFGQ